MQYETQATAFVGWEETVRNMPTYRLLFEDVSMNRIQQDITFHLKGVGTNGRDIIVDKKVIGSVMSSVVASQLPQVGDIYSRYQLADIEELRNDPREIVFKTMNIIISQIKNEYESININHNLTIWNSVLGEFNGEGLRAHPPIKIRKRRPQTMMFNMNY